MIRPGSTPTKDGTNFAIFSSVADAVELCFFDTSGQQTQTHYLANCSNGVWHDFVPGCSAGQAYGYRVHGPWDPANGMRCNPAKLLIDPHAKQVEGEFAWNDAVFDYRLGKRKKLSINTSDSAPNVPRSVVSASEPPTQHLRPRRPWSETIFYESNVRGYTMCHPAVAEAERGKFAGMTNAAVLDYIRALGITTIELMPIHAFIDEHHLADRGLRNYWGYNTVNFFAPTPRYAGEAPTRELAEMVRAIHDAGLEVILDVVYNHTGESGFHGPTVSFRGIDNLCYYRVDRDDPSSYINDSGCGNTINVDHPRVRELIVESLGYYAEHYGFDGFRFDLATILGRHSHGFLNTHPLLVDISNDERLRDLKLVAEPWDPGPSGYQLGGFPARWAEWNDKYRDSVRQFWRGDEGKSGAIAQRMHGSADLFEHNDRPPFASVNFITSHDGYTLRDLVSYEHRHNEANGEDNRDGHTHNYSSNYGREGDTTDEALIGLRRQQRLNFFATLLSSQGSPMILAGDEFGNTQHGNNNAYAQDNETGWLDWSGLEDDPEFTDQVRELIWLRRETPLLRIDTYVHDVLELAGSTVAIQWINTAGEIKKEHEWHYSNAFTLLMSSTDSAGSTSAVAVSVNSHFEPVKLKLPTMQQEWRTLFTTCGSADSLLNGRELSLGGRVIALHACSPD